MNRAAALLGSIALALPFGVAAADGTASEPGGCDKATAGVSIAQAGMIDGELVANGAWESGDGATGVLLEYRVSSDRYFAEMRLGSRGEWDVRFPHALCGEHRLRVFVFPLVGAGDHRTACIDYSRSEFKTFPRYCGPVPSFDCQWRCEGEECTGACSAKVTGAEGAFKLMVSSGRAPFKEAAPAGPGPFQFDVRCRAGDRVRLRVSGGAPSGGVSPTVEQPCGPP